MLAFRWETGARRYELTLEQDLLGDLVLRRGWSGEGNQRGPARCRCSWMSRLPCVRSRSCAAGAGAATTWCGLIIRDATG